MVTRVQTLTQRAGTCQPGFTMKTWLDPVFWKKKHQQLRNSLLQLCWTSALTRSTLVSFQMLQQLCRYFSLLKTLQNDAAGQKSQKRHYPHQRQNILKQHLKDFHIDMFHSIPKAAQAEELCRVGCIFFAPNAKLSLRNFVAPWRRVQQWPVDLYGDDYVHILPQAMQKNPKRLVKQHRTYVHMSILIFNNPEPYHSLNLRILTLYSLSIYPSGHLPLENPPNAPRRKS